MAVYSALLSVRVVGSGVQIQYNPTLHHWKILASLFHIEVTVLSWITQDQAKMFSEMDSTSKGYFNLSTTALPLQLAVHVF